MNFKRKTILITGGAGSLGKELTKQILRHNPSKIIIYSRDDQKHAIMQHEFNDDRLRFIMGDIKDYNRLNHAMNGVDYVIHAAAPKHVDKSEYNPFEYKNAIVDGAENIIKSCWANNVKSCVALSTDKASSSIQVYGAAKSLSDRLFLACNELGTTNFSVIRYGNVIGSNGSIVDRMNKDKSNVINITDVEMTRFWIPVDYAAYLVLYLLDRCSGGSILIPKLPSCTVLDFLKYFKPKAYINKIGIRPGEKLHESMFTIEDSRYGLEFEHFYMIYNNLETKRRGNISNLEGIEFKPFDYNSNDSVWKLTPKTIEDIFNDNMFIVAKQNLL